MVTNDGERWMFFCCAQTTNAWVRREIQGITISAMMGFLVAVAGTALVIYALMTAKERRLAGRSSGSADDTSGFAGDSSVRSGVSPGWVAAVPTPVIPGTAAAMVSAATSAVPAETVAVVAAVAEAAIDAGRCESRAYREMAHANLDPFQCESCISLELLQKALFPFATDRAVQ
ncbi:hypothetical protein JQ615_07000 [Bradyrhizobium jicamae]|uniref:Uncharacterized protein n=1 Tax=Bradyrhizobium jicamae TaxID=280332 RepID=A0ABS5FEC1_9BRAD|nr:hypothetical protein [Bradyrhizobium jicamae]MBR0795128.1 hypothetical protein [Bradyrhizobium jicamae]